MEPSWRPTRNREASGTIWLRILKEHGNLDLLKGLITIEGSCSLTGAGSRAADFAKHPLLAFNGDYTKPSAVCQTSVDAHQRGGWQGGLYQVGPGGLVAGRYAGPFGKPTSVPSPVSPT